MNDSSKHEAADATRVARTLATLSLSIEPEALRAVIAEGRLLEFTETLAAAAAAQISAQVVDEVAKAAVSGGLTSQVGLEVSYVFEGGDFGTEPPLPLWGVRRQDVLSAGLLRQLAGVQTITGM